MLITAFDIDLLGSMNSGTAAISIHASRAGQSIGLGTDGDMSLSDDTLSSIHVGGVLTSGDLLFRKAPEFEWLDSTTSIMLTLHSSIIVSEVSKDYNVEPDTVIFGRQFSSNAMYTTTPAVSSKHLQAHQAQIKSQIYEVANDFLPIIEGWPRLDVPDIVSLGNEITVTWYPDVRSQRLSHSQDWVGLYRSGDCSDETSTAQIRPPDSLSVSETNHVHQCYLAWQFVQRDQPTGTVRFSYEDYKVAGEYEVRYFYGDSRDGQGYKCGLQPGTIDYSTHCVLRAKATSGTMAVVKSGPAESMESIPGIESYTDPDDGAMYVSGF